MTVVHSLTEARAVLSAGRDGGGVVTLESPAAAAGYQGIGWWRALVAALAAEFPHQPFDTVLDCGGAPGHALAALRAGVTTVAVDAPPETLAALQEIAAALGGRLIKKSLLPAEGQPEGGAG